MTRETKIGLLIGLGFIVVFAVLLSHTGSQLPVGDELRLVYDHSGASHTLPDPALQSEPPRADIGTVDRVRTTPRPEAVTPAAHNPTYQYPRNTAEESPGALAEGLPTPDVFGTLPGEGTHVRIPRDTTLTGMPSDTVIADKRESQQTVANNRIAPPLPVKHAPAAVPQPGVRPNTPIVTPPPEPSIVKPDTKPKKKAPPTREVAPREYIVKKGDTIRKIIKAEYGRASTKIVDFLVSANKGHIKDKHTIIAGQKLMLPALPPEVFEPAPGFDVSKLASGVRTVTSEQLTGTNALRSDRRVAPRLALQGVKTNRQATKQARIYEVKAKDTLSSIAKKELGSSALWPEIKKLNRDIDPKKMMPGMKIELPVGEPISSTFASKRIPT